MTPIHPDETVTEAELRLEWLLEELMVEGMRRGSTFRTPVLIGGTALRRAYGLTRPSTDLDFAVESPREMRRIVRTSMKIAQKRWPQARASLRTDGQHGWQIKNSNQEIVLQIGGLKVDRQILELAHLLNDTWTLPMGELGHMKLRTALHHRNEIRDLYDIGFIARHYPGHITERQAQAIGNAGNEAIREPNRWTQSHQHDPVFAPYDLQTLGREVALAAHDAHTHLAGAQAGHWMNQASAASELMEAARREPLGEYVIDEKKDQPRVAWRTALGTTSWTAIVENDERAQDLPLQAGLTPEQHPPAEQSRERSDRSRQD